MKKTLLLLISCAFVGNVIGQNIPDLTNPLEKWSAKHQSSRSRKILIQDSLPIQFGSPRQIREHSPAIKSMSEFKQKMDSCHIDRFMDGAMNTLNHDRYAYDSEGRLILAISYTCNTWDGEYHWYKDTSSYHENGKPSLEAYYIKEQEADAWIPEYQYELFYDARGNDTLEIIGERDPSTEEWVKLKAQSEYDENDNPVFRMILELDELTGKWIEQRKYENTYDSNNNLLTYSGYLRSSDTGEWIQYYQIEATYDTAGNRTSLIYYHLDDDEQTLVGFNRSESTYDAHNNLTQFIQYLWDSETSKWIYASKELRSFDPKGNVTQFIYHSWSSGYNQWVNEEKETYTFDADGNQTEYTTYIWAIDATDWTPSYQDLRTYDPKGNLTNRIGSRWSISANQWIPSSREDNVFNANSKNTLTSSSSWDTISGAWEERSRSEKIFDASGNLFHSLLLSLRDSTGEWQSRSQFDYTYDYSYTDNEIISPYGWSGEQPFNMLLSATGKRWDPATGEWYDAHIQNYYYSAINSDGIGETLLPSIIHVFPNPAVDVIFIETDQPSAPARFELYDTNGRKVLSENLTGSHNEIPVSQLPGGVYLYQMSQNGQIQCGKILKK